MQEVVHPTQVSFLVGCQVQPHEGTIHVRSNGGTGGGIAGVVSYRERHTSRSRWPPFKAHHFKTQTRFGRLKYLRDESSYEEDLNSESNPLCKAKKFGAHYNRWLRHAQYLCCMHEYAKNISHYSISETTA